jgi:hypothetical protein
MKKLTSILLLWMLLFVQQAAFGQQIVSGRHRKIFTATGSPTYVGYTYCPRTYSGSTATSTATCGGGGTLTVAVGDVIVMECGTDIYSVGQSVVNLSDSNANSYTLGGDTSSASYYREYSRGGWAVASTAGATNFICTMTNATGDVNFAVVVYRGLLGTVDTSLASNLYPNSGSFLTSSFTTTVKDLVIVCASSGDANAGGIWMAGLIQGSTGSAVGVSGATLSTSSLTGCEARLNSSFGSGTAAMTYGGRGDYGYQVLAFKY